MLRNKLDTNSISTLFLNYITHSYTYIPTSTQYMCTATSSRHTLENVRGVTKSNCCFLKESKKEFDDEALYAWIVGSKCVE